MKAEIKKAWVQALRSGNFKQGCGFLCQLTDNGETHYCCMGVLAEIQSVPKEWTDVYKDREGGQLGFVSDGEGDVKEVRYVKRAMYQFTDDDGTTVSGTHPYGAVADEIERGDAMPETVAAKFVDMNDSKLYTFAQIADWIEENIPEE